MAAADLLIELGCEDLPARYVQPLAMAMRDGLLAALDERQLAYGEAQWYATPRRLCVLVAAVAERQPEQAIERRGPAIAAAFRDGKVTPAGEGFARSCGVEIDALERIETDKGEYLVHRAVQPGADTVELLPDCLTATLKRMDAEVPRRMRWGNHEYSFVRPVHWLLALYGDAVPHLEAFGLEADRYSYGHRFHAPAPIALNRAADYAEALRGAHVEPDFAARRERIAQQARALAKQAGEQVRLDPALLDEVAALVEWPQVMAGGFDDRYLKLPEEVIVLTIQEHQRYFPMYRADGGIAPRFITVSNIVSRDEAQVVAGNERVVRPRLDDALFFWRQDLQRPLGERVASLDRVGFARGAGSVGDKVRRLQEGIVQIAPSFGADETTARRAALLSKADLGTQMVFEFPELQGIMGAHYARQAGEDPAVAQAIAEQYRPAGPEDAPPASALGATLSVADKLDSLVTLFAAGKTPSGSKDPFALRRAAIGALRILLERDVVLDLGPICATAGEQAQALRAFLSERMDVLLRERGLPPRLVRAIQACAPLDIVVQWRRCEALNDFMDNASGPALAAAYRRARNILDAGNEASASDMSTPAGLENADRALADAIARCEGQLAGDSDNERDSFYRALDTLAGMQDAIDEFFDSVLVMADDEAVRKHRLGLLRRFTDLTARYADIGVLATG